MQIRVSYYLSFVSLLLCLDTGTAATGLTSSAPVQFQKPRACSIALRAATASWRRNTRWFPGTILIGMIRDARRATEYFGLRYSPPNEPVDDSQVESWVRQDLVELGYPGPLEPEAISDFLDSLLQRELTAESFKYLTRLFDHPTPLLRNPAQRLLTVIEHPNVNARTLSNIARGLADPRISEDEMREIVRRLLAHKLADQPDGLDLPPRIEFFHTFAGVVALRQEFAREFYNQFLEVARDPSFDIEQVRALSASLGTLARHQFAFHPRGSINESILLRAVELLEFRAGTYWNAWGSRESRAYTTIKYHTERCRLLVGQRSSSTNLN